MSTPAARAPSVQYPDTFRSPYSPGRIRRSTDNEHAAVAAFIDRHPEYGRLSHAELVTLAETYVGPEQAAERDALEDAGVPLDWHRPEETEEEES